MFSIGRCLERRDNPQPIKGTTMRGNQEAYILVKVKDGRKFVCAINRLKNERKPTQMEQEQIRLNLEKDVLWQ